MKKELEAAEAVANQVGGTIVSPDEIIAKARKEFEAARLKARTFGHVVVDTEDSFFVRKKLPVYSPSGARGFSSVTGVIDSDHRLLYYASSGWFFPTSGETVDANTIVHTNNITHAIKVANNREIKKKLRNLLRVLK